MEKKHDLSQTITMNDITLVQKKYHYDFAFYKEAGYDVQEPLRGNSKIARMVRLLWIKMRLPFRDFWVNKNFRTDRPYVLVFEGIGVEEFILWLHKKYPEKQIHLYLTNPISKNDVYLKDITGKCVIWWNDEDEIKQNIDKYKINYTVGPYKKNMIQGSEHIVYDASFVGLDKGRAKQLLTLQQEIEKRGYKTFFRICKDHIWSKNKPYYGKKITYNEVVNISCSTKVIIDILQQGQKAASQRSITAVANSKKLITNNDSIVKLPYYNKNNIFIYGKDDICGLKNFFETPYQQLDKKLYNDLEFENTIIHNFEKGSTI